MGTLVLEVQGVGGETTELADDLARLADRVGIPVMCEVNGAEMHALPGQTGKVVRDAWLRDLERVRKEESKKAQPPPAEAVADIRYCVVRGCNNDSTWGRIEGDLCGPCRDFLVGNFAQNCAARNLVHDVFGKEWEEARAAEAKLGRARAAGQLLITLYREMGPAVRELENAGVWKTGTGARQLRMGGNDGDSLSWCEAHQSYHWRSPEEIAQKRCDRE